MSTEPVTGRLPHRPGRTDPDDLTTCYVCGEPFHRHGQAGGPAHAPMFAPTYGVPQTFDTARRRPTTAELADWTADDDAALLAQQRWEQAAMFLAADESLRAAEVLVQAVGDNARTDDLLAFGLMCVAAHRRLTLT